MANLNNQILAEMPPFPKGMPAVYREAHKEAYQRFCLEPSKCYQRHIRELWEEREKREQLPSLSGAEIKKITNEQAKEIIWKYEWLHSLGSGIIACYGLFIDDELLGVDCFGKMGQKVGEICVGSTPEETRELAAKTVALQRGACVPWAPKNAASHLIRQACRLARKDYGWQIFFAFSDSDAGEVGTVYQAANWSYIDKVRGRPEKSYHSDYRSPDGKTRLTSYQINHKTAAVMKKLYSVPKDVPFREWLKDQGWVAIKHYAKGKYIWFEGSPSEKDKLKKLSRYAPRPHPKREAV